MDMIKGTYGLERVNYFPRQLITADDMTAEQEYFRQKLRRHNRFMHGWGSVCGLRVSAAPTEGEPWRVRIDSGYALSPQGDEIYIGDPLCINLARCGMLVDPDLCEPGGTRPRPRPSNQRENLLFVAVRYLESQSRPVRVHPAGCGCDETACEFSRLRDDFEIGCLLELPETHRPDRKQPSLCVMLGQRVLPDCPECPDDPWVVLAVVRLPDTQTAELNDQQIDNFVVRRQLMPVNVIQQQVIDCCCRNND